MKNARIDGLVPPRARGPKPGQLPARGRDEHVRGSRFRFPSLRIGVPCQHVDQGLVYASDRLFRQGGLHRLVESGVLKPLIEPAAGLVDESAILALSRAVPRREHCSVGSAVSCSSGPGSRDKPMPGWPGWPLCLRSLRRSRSGEFRFFRSSLRRSFASICSFELGVPRLHHGPQPGQQLALLPAPTGQARLIGHKPQGCSI